MNSTRLLLLGSSLVFAPACAATFTLDPLANPAVTPHAATPQAPPNTATPTRAPATVRTLTEAVHLALERHPSLTEAGARIRSAEAGLRRARAALWPTLGADLAVTWAEAPSVYLFKTIDARSLAPNTDFNDPGSLENTEVGVAAAWNLWRGGRDLDHIDAARFGVLASIAAEDAERNTLAAMVVGAWIEHRASRELSASDAARVRSLEAQWKDTRLRVESGSALEVDALALEVRLAQARDAGTRSELATRLTNAALRELLALSTEEELQPDLDTPQAPAVADTLERAEELALEQRGELAAARAAVDAARGNLRASENSWSPRVDLQGRVWGDDNEVGLDFEEANSALTLSLSFDALDGGMRSAGVDIARAELVSATARLRRVELAIAHDVERAWLGLDGARSRFAVAEQALRAAETGADLVGKLLAGGAATVSRFLDAEADLSRARAEHVLARIDVQRAGFELARATGSMENLTW